MIQDTVAESSRDIATEAARAAVTALLNQNSVAVGTTLQSDTNPRGATNQPRPTTSLGDPNPLCDNAESPQLPASSVQNQDIPASYVKDIQSDGSVQVPVVRKPINANRGLKVNQGAYFSVPKCCSMPIFCKILD